MPISATRTEEAQAVDATKRTLSTTSAAVWTARSIARTRKMTKKRVREFEWRITRIKSSPAAYIGRVNAPNAATAIKRAIIEFEITNPEHQRRLVAQRIG